ncbi:MAG: YhgE/Pip domain-containing protein, partial [Actinomycetota bacterium]|nr:YhgE/Pip domain-containing protein [Actinomycetota bacterium]
MNSLRIALTELRRITAGRLAKLVIVALVLVPTLYAGLYLYANHDPYAHFDELPAALIVEDPGPPRPTARRST